MRNPSSHAVILVAALGHLAGCGDGSGPESPSEIRITPAMSTVGVRETMQLEVTVLDASGGPIADAQVEWSSSNTDLATVSSTGLVTGIFVGQVEIRANYRGKTGTASLTVEPRGFARLAAGGFHTCGLTFDSRAYCWGSNLDQQLGDGTTTSHSTPTRVAGGLLLTSIDAGLFHTCGLDLEGVAYCWGSNPNGELGVGDDLPRAVPTRVATGLSFATISAGTHHTCGLTDAGEAHCWGQNRFSQLGLGEALHFVGQLTPVAVSTNARFAIIDAGDTTTCAVTADDIGYCWGDGALGTEGDSFDGFTWTAYTPVEIPGVQFDKVQSGGFFPNIIDPPVYDFACGLSTTADLYCWQSNEFAGVGIDPELIAPGPFSSLSLYTDRACTLDSEGEVECRNPFDWPRPVLPAGELRFATVEVGGSHSCGARGDGLAYCWGENRFGQLGDGNEGSFEISPPVQVVDPE